MSLICLRENSLNSVKGLKTRVGRGAALPSLMSSLWVSLADSSEDESPHAASGPCGLGRTGLCLGSGLGSACCVAPRRDSSFLASSSDAMLKMRRCSVRLSGRMEPDSRFKYHRQTACDPLTKGTVFPVKLFRIRATYTTYTDLRTRFISWGTKYLVLLPRL